MIFPAWPLTAPKGHRRSAPSRRPAEPDPAAGRIDSARSGTNKIGLPSGKPDGKTTRRMNIITAVMKWRWRRAGSGRESYFCGRGISCAGFPLVWEAEKESTNFPLLWKSRGAFLKNAADSGQFAGVFQEKYGWCGSFTNCSQETHNSVKIIGYCIIKQRVLPTRCIFSLLKHTQQKRPPPAVFFVSFFIRLPAGPWPD